MNDVQHNNALAFSARVLGALFYFAPNSTLAEPLVIAFTDGEWVTQWPYPVLHADTLSAGFASPAEESLAEAWQRLFIGPDALPSPPWGSVWLDRENVLFGDSTLALRQWMRENQIAFDVQQNEPEDHFGTLLLAASWQEGQSAEDESEALETLFAEYLRPWCGTFLGKVEAHATTPFWRTLAALTRDAIAAMWDELQEAEEE